MQYFGFVPSGRHFAEVRVTKEQGKRSTQVETGVVFPSFKAAEQAVAQKNLEIARRTEATRAFAARVNAHRPGSIVDATTGEAVR